MGKKLFFCLGCLLLSLSAFSQVETGKWQAHFSGSHIFEIALRGDLLYGAGENMIYRMEFRDGRRYGKILTKASGLSGVGITAMAYNPYQDVIIAGYQDGTLDLIYEESVHAFSDFKQSTLGTSKKINALYTEGSYAYVATDYGFLIFDLENEEISETCLMVDEEGGYEKVVDILITNGKYYLATGNRIKYAPRYGLSLNNPSVWKEAVSFADNSATRCDALWGKIMVVDAEKNVYWGDEQSEWQRLKLWEDSSYLTFAVGDGDYLVSGRYSYTEDKYLISVWSSPGTMVYETCLGNKGFNPRTGLVRNGYLYTSEQASLAREKMDGAYKDERYIWAGLRHNQHYGLIYSNRKLISSYGGYTRLLAPEGRKFEFSYWEGNEWHNKGPDWIEGFPSDFLSAAVTVADPLIPNKFYVGSSISGLAIINPDDTWEIYNDTNSPLERNSALHNDIRISGLALDASNDLWILNTFADHSLHVRHRNGTWDSYDLRVSGLENSRLSDLMVDYWQHKWVLSDYSKVAIFETDGAAITALQVDMNYGNDLQTDRVYCMVEDKLGHVWFGTNRGVKIIDQHAQMFNSPRGDYTSVKVKTVKVPRDGYLMELLKDDEVTAIAVDGANRKWLGTSSNGLFLVSSDGMEELEHFTAENSPLLSNTINRLAVDDETGEVFIACDEGLIAYKATATLTEDFDKSEVRVYPNPVKPGYEGYINIKGLPENALVKITDTRGNLIYQAKATGGQLSWNGFGMQGRKPDSGVLFVFVSGDNKKEKVAAKIFYVR